MSAARQSYTTLFGKKVRRGTKIKHGRAMRWKLLRGASERPLKGSLIADFRVGGERLTIFRII